MEHVLYWLPSIEPCGANFYTAIFFEVEKPSLRRVARGEGARRVELRGGKLVAQEVILKGETDSNRIRHVIGGPDGALYVLFRERIARIAPASAGSSD